MRVAPARGRYRRGDSFDLSPSMAYDHPLAMNSPAALAVYNRRNPAPPLRRGTRITVPDRVSSHVKLVFTEMQRQRIIYDEVEAGSGVLRPTIKAWRHKNRPNLESIEAVLNFLGWDFIPVPRDEIITPEVRKRLAPAAAALGLTMGQSLRLLTIIATGAERPEADDAAEAKETV